MSLPNRDQPQFQASSKLERLMDGGRGPLLSFLSLVMSRKQVTPQSQEPSRMEAGGPPGNRYAWQVSPGKLSGKVELWGVASAQG